jgi:c-di-GMP-binding flagellar brake protein YcgR
MEPQTPKSTLSGRPDEMLTRSRTEIANTLIEIAKQCAAVTATLSLKNEDELFVTQIRHVDSEGGKFIVDYGQNKALNSRLLAIRKLSLNADLGAAHVAWAAASPTHVVFDQRSAIRLEFPEYLVSHRRRLNPRLKVPAHLGMKCFVECPGITPFEMEIVDISLEGQGMLFSSPTVQLEAGTILRGCRIVYPGRKPIVVDLEIRYAHGPALADSNGRRRLGCRFVGAPPDVADLVRLFSIELDEFE